MDTRFPWEPAATTEKGRAANPTLSAVEVRILGCLIEKQATTPDHYPLTLNSLVLACNQTTNRDPVTSYDEGAVERALEGLRQKSLVWVVRGGRAAKYDHRFTEMFKLAPQQQAVMCVLMLRGPQTAGEVRARTGRIHAFANLEEVEATVASLIAAEPPLVEKLARLPGAKEARFAHRLAGAAPSAEHCASTEEQPATARLPEASERRADLEQEVQALRREVEELRRQVEELKGRLE